MTDIHALPHIAWQTVGRNLAVETVTTDEVPAGIFLVAAEWRYSLLITEPRRSKLVNRMTNVAKGVSNFD